ncbi:MAG: VOC family protein [Hyphomicrobiaceae bacterium]
MISALDHISLCVADVDRCSRDLTAVLGHDATPGVRGSAPRVRFQFANIGLVLEPRAPQPDSAAADADASTIGLSFAVADLSAATHRLSRRALPITPGPDAASMRIDPSATHGVPIAIVPAKQSATTTADRDIAGLDHVVIRTPDPERAVALYGGRLGLDLRLDRTNPKFANRLLFFVCGDLVVEVAHDLNQGVGSGPDQIRGLAWRANDIEAAHRRMVANGVAVSELREGRKAATRVFTVKNQTCGIPTLIIGGDGLVRS